jgi:hypothetical protein
MVDLRVVPMVMQTVLLKVWLLVGQKAALMAQQRAPLMAGP